MYVSIEGQGHFFTIYFPGFVCFVLYWAKISGERLQDHWSSGYEDLTKIICELSSDIIKYAPYFFCWGTLNLKCHTWLFSI